jgi:outer membrane protein assembly factor BamB
LLPLGIAAAAAGLIAVVRSNYVEIDSATKVIVGAVIALVAIVLAIGWLRWLAPWRTSQRRLFTRAVLLGGILVIGGLMATFRIEGVRGNLMPDLAWRWAAPRGPLVAEGAALGKGATGVDPTQSLPRDFPQFLGPERNAEITGWQLSRDWDQNPPREVWRRPIGKGWSSFAIVGQYAVTQQQEGNDHLVVCYALTDGNVVWVHREEDSFESVIAGDGPRATPTIHDGRVYTLSPNGRLTCLNLADGTELWSREVLQDTAATNLQWGKSCSPLVRDDAVIVSAGGADDQSLVAYDTTSGELLYGGGQDQSGYSSPMLATVAGEPQILIFNHASVAGHDPRDLHLLWEFPWQSQNPNVAQPLVVGDDRVFITSGYGHGGVMLQLEQDDEGALTATELWRTRAMKAKFSNVMQRGEYLYGLDDGVLACLRLEDGKRVWKRGRYGHGQVLLVGDLLLVVTESGELALVEASPEKYVELGRIEALADKTWNCPALAPPYLLVRNDREAVCFELKMTQDHGRSDESTLNDQP